MKQEQNSQSSETSTGVQALTGENPPWRAKSVWLATLVAITGAVLWIREPAQTSSSNASGNPHAATGFADSSSGAPPTERKVSNSPAIFRFGISYVAGFCLGWALRRFIKLTVLVGGALIAVVVAAQKLGWMNVDWAAIQVHTHSSLAWLRGEAGTIKQFLTGYLPSAGAAAVGAFFGFLRK